MSSSGTQRDLSQGLRGLQRAEAFLSKAFGTGQYNLHLCCCRNVCRQTIFFTDRELWTHICVPFHDSLYLTVHFDIEF